MLITGADAKAECGADQLCAGVEAGIEAAIHAMNDLFNDNVGSGWGVLLVDAANAFSALNRKAALWQVRFLWPRAARFLFNTYKGWAILVVQGTDEFLYSMEQLKGTQWQWHSTPSVLSHLFAASKTPSK